MGWIKSVDYSRLKKNTISYYIKKYGLNQKCFIYETSENVFENVKLYEGKLAFVPLKLRSYTVYFPDILKVIFCLDMKEMEVMIKCRLVIF